MGLSTPPGEVSGSGNPMIAPVVPASPATIRNTNAYSEDCIISAGTVTAIALTRGSGSVVTGLIDGIVTLSPGDSVEITYTVAPTVTVVPR